MPQGPPPHSADTNQPQRVNEFVREAEAFLASRGGGHDPTVLPALAYQFGLSREEYQQAMHILYTAPVSPVAAQPPPPIPPQTEPAQPEAPPPVTLPSEILGDEAQEPTDDEPLIQSEAVAEDDQDYPGVRPQDLYSFTRQARLILADARGWSEQALARINFLADQFLIPHDVRGNLYRRLEDTNFNPQPPSDGEPTADPMQVFEAQLAPDADEGPTKEELEAAKREKAEKKKRQSPSKLYKIYLRKAMEALPVKRVNERRETKLILEGTTKLGLGEALARDLLLEVAKERGYVVASEEERPEERDQKQAKAELITTFQQRAATIIAGQGGVNSLTRIMIAQVATDLGLSDQDRDTALASIQKQSEKNQSDTRQQQRADSFRQFARERLDNMSHGIVIATLAQQLVQIGVDMHGIHEDLAWSTLREVLQEEDLRLVTVQQAESHIKSLVDELMREEGFLSIQSRQRLMAEGEQWGLDHAHCQQMIEDRVVEYTRRQNRGQRQVAMIFGAFFALLIFGGGYIIYLGSIPPKGSPTARHSPGKTSTDLGNPDLDTPTEDAQPEVLTWQRQPWWGESLSLNLLKVYQDETSLQPRLTAICTDDSSRRASAYRALLPQLVAKSVAEEGETRDAIRASVSGLVHDEPSSEAVEVIAQTLTEGISLKDAPISAATPLSQMLEKAFLSVQAAQQPGLPEDRRELFLSELEQQLGITYSGSADPVELTMSEMIREQYRKIRDLSANDPNAAARLHADLSKMAQSYLPVDQVLAKDSLLIADIAGRMTENWSTYQPVVQRVISSEKTDRLLPILDAFEQGLKNSAIQQELSRMLSRRIGRGLDADDPVQSAAIVRTELGLDAVVVRDGEMYRMFTRRSASFDWQPPADIAADELAKEVTELSFLSVLGHAASQGDMGQRIFEETLKKGPPTYDAASAAGTSVTPSSTKSLAALSKIESLVERLHRASNPLGRIDIYRELCSLAGDVEDVDYTTAAQLAEYLLAPKPRAEQSQIQSGIRAFSHWTNIKLAVADQVHTARRAADDMAEIVSGLLGETIVVNNVRTARDELQERLLRSGLEGLGSQPAQSGELSPQMANDIATFLADHYRQHARLSGISLDQLGSSDLPDAIVARLIELERAQLEQMTLTDAEAAKLQDITRREIALNYLSNSPIASMVAKQRVWLRLMTLRHSKERPQFQGQLGQILDKLEQQDAAATSLIEQLRSGELAFVKVWELTGGSA
ncbi:hypothetical protein Pan97_01030 [Bremerella volcania]|uniref:Uncharacterized protein n=1 Tax=Bremerella volcania TaxID=2527984 RepID=A0A518C1N5_9BACT|nr:hypothetical protein [Bremerella volcania]QDU73136.1 hypothetical protein Pan97_01030 [Bremerella volcania]